MVPSVLGSISLGYQFLWNRLRQPAAVQLFVESDASTPVDGQHLLGTLRGLWPEQAPPLLLNVRTPLLFLDVLHHGSAGDPSVLVPQDWLGDPLVIGHVQAAHARGLELLWHGAPGERPATELAIYFKRLIIALTPEEALRGVLAQRQQAHLPNPTPDPDSPVQAGEIYEGVASQALAAHCLDQQGAWGLTNWPAEDVLHRYRGQMVRPSRRAVGHLIHAIETDAALDTIEQALYDEPVLAYQFLRYINAPERWLRHEVGSVRHGLMLLGYAALKNWLLEQLPGASGDPDLYPLRTAMVTRAHLMERLLDPGEEPALRHEIYLCGLLSQLPYLLHQPLENLLEHLPVSERIHNALRHGSGPYAPYLAIARALESSDTRATHLLCDSHEISLDDVNRALLRTLCTLPAHAR